MGERPGLRDGPAYGHAPLPRYRLAPGTPGALGLFGTATAVAPALTQLSYNPYQFTGLEGLGEEGVDPDVESGINLLNGASTDDHDRDTARMGVGTKPRGGPQPVESRHHDVQGDHIRPNLMHHIQTFGTISRGHDLEALQLEIDPDQLPNHLVVVHNKHSAGRAWHNSRVGPPAPPRPGFPHFRPVQGTTTLAWPYAALPGRHSAAN